MFLQEHSFFVRKNFLISSKKYKLIINAKQINPIKLVGPIDKGQMTMDVYESITSKLSLELFDNNKKVLESSAKNVGMECMNYE